MKRTDEQRISRGLDAELDDADREKLERLMAADPEAEATRKAWEDVGDRLRREAARVEAPDAAVAWQDIRREIRSTRDTPAARPALPPRFLWAGALATVLVIGTLAWSGWRMLAGPSAGVETADAVPAGRVDWVVAEIPGATTVIYTDAETDLTVIWMDVAQNGEPRDS